jgi:hypothetical protein
MSRTRTKAQREADRLRSGRPPLQPGKRKTSRLTIRMTDSEFARICRAARAEGITPGDLLMRPFRKEEKKSG